MRSCICYLVLLFGLWSHLHTKKSQSTACGRSGQVIYIHEKRNVPRKDSCGTPHNLPPIIKELLLVATSALLSLANVKQISRETYVLALEPPS